MGLFNMADLSRDAHNSSPMPGVVRNPDPALDISKEHHHGHIHHGAHAEKGHTEHDHPAYTKGTTVNEPSVIPAPDPNDDALHRHHHPERAAEHDIEKTGGFTYDEKNSMRNTRSSSDPHVEEEVDPKRHWVSRLYKRYRVFVHIFIGALFTG